MKIKGIRTYLVRPRWCMVEVLTDEGISGWGEAVIEGKASTVAACVREMEEYLIGKDADRIQDIWNMLYRCAFYRGGPILTSCISGIEQALWDIKGKKLGVPVYEMLGGRVRDKIRMYCHTGGSTPEEAAETLTRAIELYLWETAHSAD